MATKITEFGRSKFALFRDFAPSVLLQRRRMELPASPSSHQFNVRKAGEPGLAEWAQKIRALQRQVDDDEEEEHRKLEQEIAASRLARVRRSAAYDRSSLDPAVGMPSPSSVAGQHED